jgi:flagellar hook-length control protein FliK
MNQINEAYTFVQIPLKMTNQNASGQLYVYTSKRNLEDPERELTAFLHLDLEHLGATDVSVKMHKKEVATKFYMESDASYDLVKAYMPQLEERLRAKGYNCKIEIENEGRHVNFVEDFLKKDAPSAGMLHRYSFDVRT